MGNDKENKDPRKNMDKPAEEQQLEQHSSVSEDTKETAQVIEDDKLEEEKRRSEKELDKKDSAEKNVSSSERHLEDKDRDRITNKPSETVNKKGQ